MTKAEIAKGIRGIRETIKANRKGWHIFCDDEYRFFQDETLDEIRLDHPDWILIDVTGNGLVFQTRGC
jgi:hypothetical protein